MLRVKKSLTYYSSMVPNQIQVLVGCDSHLIQKLFWISKQCEVNSSLVPGTWAVVVRICDRNIFSFFHGTDHK